MSEFDDSGYEGESWKEDMKPATYSCGHPGLIDREEDDPGPGELCWGCRPCRDCGARMSDCACPAVDPFVGVEQ